MSNESHKEVPGATRYCVSIDGKVYNRRTGKQRKTTRTGGGYDAVLLVDDEGKQRWYFVHRLVYAAHIALLEVGEGLVCHRNDDKQDNHVENLYLGTAKQNHADMLRNGRNYWASKTHCDQGHAFDETNTYLANNGRHRKCRECKRRIEREWRGKQNG